MFDIKVSRDWIQRGVSTTKARTVGKEEERADVMKEPDPDQVKASICPGVSTRI